MQIEGIDFPEQMMSALRDNRLVVFAGAGVSMGDPARLPSFDELAIAVARGTGQIRVAGEPIDRFLGRLALRDVNVHRRAVRELSGNHTLETPLHKSLLKCFPDDRAVRVVTTNFDLLFEQAAEKVLPDDAEVYTAAALPPGTDFSGIVHIHGSVQPPANIVLTDSDFGRAYLTEGWARRFLVDLFNAFTVLFVGYSHDDIVMSYLARALPATDPALDDAPRRFALTPEADDERWEFLGITPIGYPLSASGDHSALGAGVEGLASYMRRDFRQWQRTISDIAHRPPPPDQQSSDLIADSLTDPVRTRFFTDAADDPEWVDWLDERELLDPVFQAELSGDARRVQWVLTRWLCASFAKNHAEVLDRLFARRGMLLTGELWLELAFTVSARDEGNWDHDVVSKWVSLLLEQIPAHVLNLEIHLHNIALVAGRAGMDEALFMAFGALARRCLSERDSSIQDNWAIDEVWKLHVAPLVARAAERLLQLVLHLLRERHQLLSKTGGATRNYSTDASEREAIDAEHNNAEENTVIDVVIDACRDCLEHLTENSPDVASTYIDQLIRDESPLLRRIALHCAGKRADLSADLKMDWLLEYVELYDQPCRRELFQFLERTYLEASEDRRKLVLAAVERYPDDGPEYEGRDLFIAHTKLNWLTRLGQINPHCSATKSAREQLQVKFPDIPAHDYLEDSYANREVRTLELQSPWSVDELLGEPPAAWMPQLVDFKGDDPFAPSAQGLVNCVQQAATRDFAWGVALGEALVAGQHWDTELWRALFGAWTEELGEHRYLKILAFLDNAGVFQYHTNDVTRMLVGFVREGNRTYAAPHLAYANDFAVRLWPHAAVDVEIIGTRDWHSLAVSHAAGQLAEFWLYSLSIGLRENQLEPVQLFEPYRLALDKLLQDDGAAGAMAVAMLMSGFQFLLHADKDWTEEHLAPLLTQASGSERHQAAWCGLMRGPLSRQIIESMEGPFLVGAACVLSLPDPRTREEFVDCLACMMIDVIDDPIEVWLPLFMLNGGNAERRRFAWKIWKQLGKMTDAEQQELWDRWLRRYWENRLDGVPVPLEDFEAEWMLNWLPELHSLFAEAIELALLLPVNGVQVSMLMRALSKGHHCEQEPDAVTNLLIYLADTEAATPPFFDWQELIERLLGNDLSQSPRESLEELRVRIGIS